MSVSSQTLYDLDILSYDNIENTLFKKINYCKTKGGELHLREACNIPFDRDTIKHRQAAIKYITEHLIDWSFPVRENEIFYTEQYLKSNYRVIKTKNLVKQRALSLFKLFFHKPQYHFILSGVKQLILLSQSMRDMYIRAYKQDMPLMLKELFAALNENLNRILLNPGFTEIFLNGEPSPSVLFRTDRLLRAAYQEHVIPAFALYYKLEALYSLACAHVALKLNFPVLTDNAEDIYITDLTHPLIQNCTGNPFQISRNQNLIIITGPNMAGKSSYIKSIGTAFFMAYLGIGIAATEAQIPLLSRILTSIQIKDDVSKGYSYFYNEVRAVKSIAAVLQTKEPVLVIADELFKGTNVRDTFDCSEIVLNGFLNHPESIFIVATHLIELAEKFSNDKRCVLHCFDGSVNEKSIVFNYVLKNGISSMRLGTHILKQENIPALLGLKI